MIVKSKRRLCGTGAALANAPLVQDKSYFEVKIQTGGMCMRFWMYAYISAYTVCLLNVNHQY